MERRELSMPEIELIAITRAMAGAGVGLLLAGWLDPPQRRAVGWTLVAVGAITTIPIVTQLLRADKDRTPPRRQPARESLAGAM